MLLVCLTSRLTYFSFCIYLALSFISALTPIDNIIIIYTKDNSGLVDGVVCSYCIFCENLWGRKDFNRVSLYFHPNNLVLLWLLFLFLLGMVCFISFPCFSLRVSQSLSALSLEIILPHSVCSVSSYLFPFYSLFMSKVFVFLAQLTTGPSWLVYLSNTSVQSEISWQLLARSPWNLLGIFFIPRVWSPVILVAPSGQISIKQHLNPSQGIWKSNSRIWRKFAEDMHSPGFAFHIFF